MPLIPLPPEEEWPEAVQDLHRRWKHMAEKEANGGEIVKTPADIAQEIGDCLYRRKNFLNLSNYDKEAVAGIVQQALIDLLESINADAEADMLAGNPVTGAHHRAIEKHLERLRREIDRPNHPGTHSRVGEI